MTKPDDYEDVVERLSQMDPEGKPYGEQTAIHMAQEIVQLRNSKHIHDQVRDQLQRRLDLSAENAEKLTSRMFAAEIALKASEKEKQKLALDLLTAHTELYDGYDWQRDDEDSK